MTGDGLFEGKSPKEYRKNWTRLIQKIADRRKYPLAATLDAHPGNFTNPR
jgi:hypothetical protein